MPHRLDFVLDWLGKGGHHVVDVNVSPLTYANKAL
jgi:hypothetical protein